MSNVTQPRLAVFTIMYEEEFFFPYWVRHYQQYFHRESMYVLANNLRHGGPFSKQLQAAKQSGVNVVQVDGGHRFDHTWLRDTVMRFQRFLLQSFDWVLFAEADELVGFRFAPSPGTCRDQFRDRFVGRDPGVVRCSGYEVVQVEGECRAQELPINDALLGYHNVRSYPALAIRSRWYPSKLYSKPLLSSIPLNWSLGFHDAEQATGQPPDDELLLVHLHKYDRTAALNRRHNYARLAWAKSDVERGLGAQNRLTSAEDLDRFFQMSVDDPDQPAPLVEIPQRVRAHF